MDKIKEALKAFPFNIAINVQWGEMDAAQHVNNVVYLRWSETARIGYFEKLNIVDSFNSEAGPILGWMDCKYIFPVTFPDTIFIGVKVDEILEDRFMMSTHLFSKKHDRIVAISKQSILAYDYKKLCKTTLPKNWINQIRTLEKMD